MYGRRSQGKNNLGDIKCYLSLSLPLPVDFFFSLIFISHRSRHHFNVGCVLLCHSSTFFPLVSAHDTPLLNPSSLGWRQYSIYCPLWIASALPWCHGVIPPVWLLATAEIDILHAVIILQDKKYFYVNGKLCKICTHYRYIFLEIFFFLSFRVVSSPYGYDKQCSGSCSHYKKNVLSRGYDTSSSTAVLVGRKRSTVSRIFIIGGPGSQIR